MILKWASYSSTLAILSDLVNPFLDKVESPFACMRSKRQTHPIRWPFDNTILITTWRRTAAHTMEHTDCKHLDIGLPYIVITYNMVIWRVRARVNFRQSWEVNQLYTSCFQTKINDNRPCSSGHIPDVQKKIVMYTITTSPILLVFFWSSIQM